MAGGRQQGNVRELERLRAEYIALATTGQPGGEAVSRHARRFAAWQALSRYVDRYFPDGLVEQRS